MTNLEKVKQNFANYTAEEMADWFISYDENLGFKDYNQIWHSERKDAIAATVAWLKEEAGEEF